VIRRSPKLPLHRLRSRHSSQCINRLGGRAERWQSLRPFAAWRIFPADRVQLFWRAIVSGRKGNIRRETPILLLPHLSGA
jgi:hypothetical protein